VFRFVILAQFLISKGKFKMQKISKIMMVLSLICASLSLAAKDLTITHTKGKFTLKNGQNLNKILVLDVPSLDNLDFMQVAVNGVPSGNLPTYLAQYQDAKYAKIGSLFEPDYEAINAAEADLAIVGGRSSAKYAQVNEIVPTIDMSLDSKNYLTSAKNNIQTLGQLFGKQEIASAMVAMLDDKLAKLKEVAPKAGKIMILITNAGNTGIYGPNSRLGWLYNEVGFKGVSDNIDDRSHGGDGVSFEFIMAKNPDWLLVIDRDAAVGQKTAGKSAKQVLDNALVHKTTAWQKGQIIYLHPQEAYITSSGYQALVVIMDQIYNAMSKAVN